MTKILWLELSTPTFHEAFTKLLQHIPKQKGSQKYIPPSTIRILRLCRNCEMGDHTDTRKCFPAKSVGPDSRQVFECLEL